MTSPADLDRDLKAIYALDGYLRRKFEVDPPKRLAVRTIRPTPYVSLDLNLVEIVKVVREAQRHG